MKFKKIDYKIVKNYPNQTQKTLTSKPYPHTIKKKNRRIYTIIAFLGFIFALYYLLNNFTNLTHDYIFPKIPHLSHYLLINQSQQKSLHSIIMFSLFLPRHTLIASFFPPQLSWTKNKPLKNIYDQYGTQGLVQEFEKQFGISFYYQTVNPKFYKIISKKIQKPSISLNSLENQKKLPPKSPHKNNPKNPYQIQNAQIDQFLGFHQNQNIKPLDKQQNTLYTILNFFENTKKILNQTPPNLLSSIKSEKSFLPKKAFIQILPKIHYIYPYLFPSNQKINWNTKTQNYLNFIRSIQRQYDKKENFTPQHYFSQLKSQNIIQKSLIRLKIIDQSGRGYQNDDPFQDFFRLLHFDIVRYVIHEQIIQKSYLVNIGHNLPLLKYAQLTLQIPQAYHTTQKKNKNIDLLLVLGQNFSKIQ